MSNTSTLSHHRADAGAATATAFELTILMPCLNEKETLGTCIRKARTSIENNKLNAEILIADNGSTDGSQEIAAREGARVIHVRRRGYGNALLSGIVAAQGKYVIMADADDSYDLSNVTPFVEKLREGYDLVMGNRFKGEIATGAMPFLHRYLGTPVLTMLSRIFFRTPCGDVNCGMRGFRKEAVERLSLRSPGMEFASEMLVKSALFGLRIAEIPTSLARDGRSTPPHLRTWRDGWRHLRFMLLYSPRWLFLYPGFALMLLGILSTFWLLPSGRYIGRFGFDVGTLIYSAIAVFIGYQVVTFAVFAKIFAITQGLLPPDQRLNRLFRFVNLETGLITGSLMVLVGLGISIAAVAFWGAHGFGALDPLKMIRLIVPGGILLTLGFQTIFSSFFLSVLGMARR
jgi:glycosyltransferase involved in cell wall biosynthesis